MGFYCTGSLVRGCFSVENATVPCGLQWVESADMGDVIWRANCTWYMDFLPCGGLVPWFPCCSLNVRESVKSLPLSHPLSVMYAFLLAWSLCQRFVSVTDLKQEAFDFVHFLLIVFLFPISSVPTLIFIIFFFLLTGSLNDSSFLFS